MSTHEHPPLAIPVDDADALSLRGLQHDVDAWIAQYEEGYFPPLASLARMAEEVGELARALSHADGFKRPKPDEDHGSVEEELGDILFVTVCLANQHGIDLDGVMRGVMRKIATRDRARWTLRVSGDGTED